MLPSLVFPQLLADQKGSPAALMFWLGAEETDALLLNVDFHTLCAQFPCLFDPTGLARQLTMAMAAAGARSIAPAMFHRAEAALPATLAPGAQWIIGDWYLAPPPAAVAIQADSPTDPRAPALQLLQLVAADADAREIDTVLRRIPVLFSHLLRLVNSLCIDSSGRVTDFVQAVQLFGRQQMRRWLYLMLFADSAGLRSGMLLARAAVRARMLELTAGASGMGKPEQEQAFLAGLFSMLGTLFGMPLEDVLRPLEISDTLRAAVLEQEGEIGRLLAMIVSAEQGDFVALMDALDALRLAHSAFTVLGIQAYTWMVDVVLAPLGHNHG